MELENYDGFPQNIPLVIEDDIFLYPFMIAPLFLSNEHNIKAIEYAIEHNKLIMVTISKHGKEGKREAGSFYDVGVVGNIMRKVSLPDGKIKVLFQGLVKGHINEFTKENELFANVDILKTEETNEESIKSVIEVLIDNVKKLSRLNTKFPADLIKTIEEINKTFKNEDINILIQELEKILNNKRNSQIQNVHGQKGFDGLANMK